MNIINGKYKYFSEKILGKGNFATVYLGIINSTKEKVAVKLVDMSKVDHKNKLSFLMIFIRLGKL